MKHIFHKSHISHIFTSYLPFKQTYFIVCGFILLFLILIYSLFNEQRPPPCRKAPLSIHLSSRSQKEKGFLLHSYWLAHFGLDLCAHPIGTWQYLPCQGRPGGGLGTHSNATYIRGSESKSLDDGSNCC